MLPRYGRATGSAYTARYLATRTGRASLTIRDGRGRLVARRNAATVAGRNRITVRRRIPAGVYTVAVTVTGDDRQRAVDALRLVLGGRLPARVARAALQPSEDRGSNCATEIAAERSRRFGPRRVDWQFRLTGDLRWCETGSALLTRHGTIRVRTFTCPRPGRPAFPAHPRYDDSGREVAPTQAL